jgi:hypothetical protein
MISKHLMVILIFIGILFITISIVKDDQKCQDAKIIYRYIPRTFEEEQNEPVFVSDIFKTMFTQQSPWVASVQNLDTKKKEVMNDYFISQY